MDLKISMNLFHHRFVKINFIKLWLNDIDILHRWKEIQTFFLFYAVNKMKSHCSFIKNQCFWMKSECYKSIHVELAALLALITSV